ncbi:unnamed protein product, partial [Mesorhabditis spiculigera]
MSADIEKIRATLLAVRDACDRIPVENWGFAEDVLEKLKERKFQAVSEAMPEEEQKKASKKRKHQLAKTLGVVPKKVGEVIGWMRDQTEFKDTEARKPDVQALKKAEKAKQPEKAQPKKGADPKENKAEAKKEPKKPATAAKQEEAKPAAKATSSKAAASVEKPAKVPENPTVKGKPEKTKAKKTEPEVAEEMDTTDAVPTSAEQKISQLKINDGDSSEESHDEEDVDKDLQQINGKGKFGGKHMKRKGAAGASTTENKLIKIENSDGTIDRNATREATLKKLQEKLEGLKVARRGKKDPVKFENERKLKRRMSKLKLKQRRADEKENKPAADAPEAAAKADTTKAPVKLENVKKEAPKAADPEFSFNKLDFLVKNADKPLTKNEKRDKFTGKDFKRLLEKAEKRQERIDSIRTKNPEKAEKIEESIKWKKVLQQAEGKKVRDNVDLLKKAMKRKEKTKDRTKKKWGERTTAVEEKVAKKQDKRDTNLQKRKDDVKKRKMDKLRKKGRIL